MESIFDFSLFYYCTAILFGIGVVSVILKDPVAKIIEHLDEKSNGRTTAH